MVQVLGIIGGGQLGMMITEAAKNLPGEISEIIDVAVRRLARQSHKTYEESLDDFYADPENAEICHYATKQDLPFEA